MKNGSGSGGEIAKRAGLITIKHTAQMVGAVVIIITAAYAFAEPAVKQYVEDTVAEPLKKLRDGQKLFQAEQRNYRKRMLEKFNDGYSRQLVIIEKQRVQEIMQAESRGDIKELLRIMRSRQ